MNNTTTPFHSVMNPTYFKRALVHR